MTLLSTGWIQKPAPQPPQQSTLRQSYAVNLNHAHEELQDLVERVTIELELINVAKELER